MSPNDADGMANSVDPDQTAPGSALFAQTCLSENLGTLRYEVQPMFQVLGQSNDPKFSDRQVWANSVDPDQTAPHQGIHTLFAIPSTSFGHISQW